MLRIGIAVVCRGEFVLVGRRPPGAGFAGLAEFPGGKCRPDEAPEACAVRECLEETGLQIAAEELLHHTTTSISGQPAEIWFWRCRSLDTDAQTPVGECDGFRWQRIADAVRLPFPPANAPVIDWLSRQISSPGPGDRPAF